MNRDTLLKLQEFFRFFANAPASLLMLDFDGTLAPSSARREQAFPYPGVGDLLHKIVISGRTRLAVVSNYSVPDIATLLGFDPCPEIWSLHKPQLRRPETAQSYILSDETTEALGYADQWLSYQRLRDLAEFKEGSIAVHWRGLDQCLAEELRGRVLLGWRQIAKSGGLRLLEFDGGIEIRSRDTDKGDVVRFLLDRLPPGAAAAFLGDDVDDEAAFRALKGRGLSALACSERRETTAQLWLRPPDDVQLFLAQWLEATTSHNPETFSASAP